MPNAPFPIQPELTAIAIGYQNTSLIADEVFPRIPVGKQEFKYLKLTMGEAFTVPDTKVGRKSKPNEVEFSATEVTDSTNDYGLDDPVPQADIDNAPPNYNPLGRATEMISNLIALDREVRAASLAFTLGNYGASNRTTLSGTTQWSDFTNSNPISDILTALDACVMRPNVMVIGQAAYVKLATHPKVVQAFYGNAATSGIVRREFIAQLFELDKVLVGQGFVNSAKKGQTVAISRVWGKHCSLIYQDRTADNRGGTTFGFTAQFGGRVAGAIEDRDIGIRGGQRVRVGESIKELITANDLGYFFKDAVA
jgi:hypothetical protein